jgi:uncharacterized membrane protein YcaP (DUF421 family)
MDVVIRATVMFFALYALLRMLGKRELGQMTPFELVVIVAMGDLIQQGVTQDDFSITGAILAVSTFALWATVLSWIGYLSPTAARALDGEPSVLVQDGKTIPANLHRDRITAAELESEMRLAGIAKLDDVAWAILEPNGKISFIARDRRKRSRQKDDARAA